MVTLLDKIKHLVPDAKCAVWETTDISKYHGERGAIKLKGCLIDWQKGNRVPCPTAKMLDEVDEEEVKQRLEDEKKQHLISYYETNKMVMMGYRTHLLFDPKLTFEQFLKDNDFIQ